MLYNYTRTRSFLALVMLTLTLGFASATPQPQEKASKRDGKMTRPHKVGLNKDQLEKITDIMNEGVAQQKIAGAVTLVARNGKIAYLESAGYLDLDEGSEMGTDAIFRIMSISKVLTSTAVMMLVEDGKIRLDDPISKYIPAFAQQTVAVDFQNSTEGAAAQTPITIRHLMTHRGGFPYLYFPDAALTELYRQNQVGDWNIFGQDETIDEYVNRLAGLPRFEPAGSNFNYGGGTDILGYLIEIVSGQTLDAFFQERIFDPLNMEDSHFWLPEEDLHRFPTVYSTQPEGGLEVWDNYQTSPFSSGPQRLLSGASGVLSTAEDFVKFAEIFLNKGKSNGARLISKKTVESMTSNHIGDGFIQPGFRFWGDKFGLGWGLRTERGEFDDLESLGTLTFSGVYSPKVWIDPAEDMVVLFFTQVLPYNFDYRSVAAEVKNAAWAAIVD